MTIDRAARARQAADVLAGALPELVGPRGDTDRRLVIGEITRPELARLVVLELRELMVENPDLAAAARRAGQEVHQNGAWSALRDDFSRTLRDHPDKLEAIWALLEAAGATKRTEPPPGPPDAPTPVARSTSFSGHLATVVALILITGVVLAPMALAGQRTGQDLLRGFAVLVLASLPGWLFLRFIVFRAGSLWTDYVLHLHRLRMDHHPNLPEPPLTSGYHVKWAVAGGEALAARKSVYQQKFEAYYGKAAVPSAASPTRLLRDRSVLTVMVTTAIFAVGWAAVLSGDTPLTGKLDMPVDALRFGFMGAYSFSLQMLMRRFFQSDLKASAYIASSVRVITVLILVFVLARTGVADDQPGAACAAAFLIGFFPLVGMQLLQRLVASKLQQTVPTLRNSYPLSDLDGLNIWYEARMLEEGIEDMQNLVTANIVDVLLHTKVPVGRLVDWIDQAHLLLMLDPGEANDPADERTHADRIKLRRLGIRTATDLESAITQPAQLARRAGVRAVSRIRDKDDDNVAALRAVLDGGVADPAVPSAVDGMLKSFCNMPNLVHVRHWRDVGDVEGH